MTKDELEQELESSERALSRAKAKINKLNEEVEKRDGRVGELKKKLHRLTQEHNALSINFEKSRNENNALNGQISDLKRQLEKLQTQYANLRHKEQLHEASLPLPHITP